MKLCPLTNSDLGVSMEVSTSLTASPGNSAFISREFNIKAVALQNGVLNPPLHLIYTADLPTKERLLTSTFVDDTAILCIHSNPSVTSRNLEMNGRSWALLRMKVNETCSHVTFILRKRTCPLVRLNSIPTSQSKEVKYLWIHLDRRPKNSD